MIAPRSVDSRADALAVELYLFGAMARGPIRDRELDAFFYAFVLGLPLTLLSAAAFMLWLWLDVR